MYKNYIKRTKSTENNVISSQVLEGKPTISSSEMGPILRISRFDVITASGPENAIFKVL